MNIHSLSVATQDNYYWYDDLQQVKRHDRGDLTPSSGPPYTGIDPTTRQQQEDFTFDETGNWNQFQTQSPALVQTRTHDTANQIASLTNPSGIIQPVYDALGNMTTMPKAGDWTTSNTLKWDAWNRLVKLTEGSNNITYAYDAFTRRTIKTNSATSETRHYYYDRQWRAVEERVAGAAITVDRQYTWSPLDRWTLIRRKRTVTTSLDETRFILKDYLDPAAIIDSSATVDERFGYDAFGKLNLMTPAFATRTTSVCDWNFLFHAEFQDTDSGLYNYGYRYYHPELGRWPSRDPIEEKGGINLYGFVGNDGVNRWDILGNEWHAVDVYIRHRGTRLGHVDPTGILTPFHASLEFYGKSAGVGPGQGYLSPVATTDIVVSPDLDWTGEGDGWNPKSHRFGRLWIDDCCINEEWLKYNIEKTVSSYVGKSTGPYVILARDCSDFPSFIVAKAMENSRNYKTWLCMLTGNWAFYDMSYNGN